MNIFAFYRYWFAYGQYDAWEGNAYAPIVTANTQAERAYRRGYHAKLYRSSFRHILA